MEGRLACIGVILGENGGPCVGEDGSGGAGLILCEGMERKIALHQFQKYASNNIN